MKRLFLASTVEWPGVADSIFRRIGKKSIRMPFIMTPAEVLEEDMSWLEDERKMLREAGFDIFDYSITGKTLDQITSDLQGLDALYISGGNEYYLKYQCNITGFGDFIREWIENGKPYIGSSGGSMVLAPDMSPSLLLTDTHIPGIKIDDYTGLGLVNFLIMPHWGGTEFKEIYLGERKEKMYNTGNQLILLNNYQYVQVIDDKFQIIDVRNE